ncbi:MAG: hypothetical protein RL173_1187 [Fibrobacterota bacterium]|jgi:hypothetical protein
MLAIAPLLAGLVSAPQMLLHLRADTGIVLDASQRVALWKDLSPRHTDFGTTNFPSPRAVFLTRFHDTAEKRVYKTFDSNEQLRPRVVAKGIGGHPSVVFDGSQVLVDTTSLPLDAGFTLFAVAQDSTGNGNAATLIDKGPGDMNTALSNGWADSINGCYALGIPWVDNVTTSNFASSSPTLYGSSWDGHSGNLWANGQFLSTGTWVRTIKRNKETWIGGVKNPHGDLQAFLDGRISEIRVYAGALDSSTRKSIEDSLKCRYGIDLSACPPPKASDALLLHLRADTGLVLDSRGLLATWKDLSPRHTDFVTTNFGLPRAVFVTRYHDTAEKRVYKTYAADSLLRPRVAQNGIGGKPSVVFEGQQALVDTTTLPLDSGFTLFAVAQDSTGIGYAATLIDKGPGDMNTALSNGWADSINGCFALGIPWINNITTSNFASSSPTLYGSSWDGRKGNLWANGQFLSTGTWSSTIKRNKETWIGGVKNPYGDLQSFLKGRISEIRIYRGALDDSLRKKIQDSLIERYSILSPLPPPPVDDGMILHLRADTGVILDSRGKVATWKDLSTRHTNFVTTSFGKPKAVFLTRYHDTASKRVYKTYDADSLLRPRVVQNGIGGRPSIAFDGEQALCDTTSLPLDSGFTLFAVAQDSTGNGHTAILVDKGPGDFNTDLPNGWDDSINGCFNMGVAWVRNFAQSNVQTSNPALYQSAWNGQIGSLWINGQFLASGTGSNPSARNKSTWIGGVENAHNTLQNFLTGRISEIRIYRGILDSNLRKAIQDSLIARYRIGKIPPPPVANGLILHLRADTGVILDSRGKVATWKDLSPRHTNFLTPNLGKPKTVLLTRFHDTAEKRVYKTLDADSLLRPNIVKNGINGLPSVSFDGLQTLVDTSSLPLDSGFTAFIVAQDSTAHGQAATMLDKAPGDFNFGLPNGWDDDTIGSLSLGVGWVASIAHSDFETKRPCLYEASFGDSTGIIRTNGRFLTAGKWKSGSERNKSTWLAGTLNSHQELQNFMTGRISEIQVYSGVLDSATRVSVEMALIQRYSIVDSGAHVGIGARNTSSETRIFKSGSAFQISTTEFDRAILYAPNGRILSTQAIVGGRATLPAFRGTAILQLAIGGKRSISRVLVSDE